MTDEKKILDYLEQNLSAKRLKHTMGVSKTAEEMAIHYGCDVYKARIAGLVHDCAKEKSRDELLQMIRLQGLKLDEMMLNLNELLHGPAAVYICRKEFNIIDEEILSAVMYHTSGKKAMTLLEKIIFLADYIEPNRDFRGVVKLRRLAFKDLNKAILSAYDKTIEYIIKKKGYIHIDTIISRNYLLQEMKEKTVYL